MKKTSPLFFSGVFFLIIGIALVIYFFTRKSKTGETEETGDLPTVKDAGIELVLNPADAADKVEEYSMFKTEYALGAASAKNIDIKLTWTNGPTFASVGSLIFVHKANGNKVREDIITTDNVTSNASNELIFKGSDMTLLTNEQDIVGTNTIDMYWNKIDDNTNKLTTISFTVTQEHLDTPFNLTEVKKITVPVQLSSSSKASGDVIATYTNYYILPYFYDKPVYNRKVNNNNGFNIIQTDGGVKQTIGGVDTFYIVEGLGKKFLSKDKDGNTLLRYDKVWKSQNEIFGSMSTLVKSAITVRDAKPFKYEFIIKHLDYLATQPQHNIAAHINNVKLYDFSDTLIKTVTNNDIEFDVEPKHKVNSSDYLGAWKSNTYNVGDRLFTITSDKPVKKLTVEYGRPRYAPGWTIKENGLIRFEDVRNHGTGELPTPVTYTYTLSRFDDGIGHLWYSGYYDVSEMEDIGMEYGLINPNNTHSWQYDINTYEGCRLRAKETNGYNAFGFQSIYHTDTNDKQGTCWLRQVPGEGTYTFKSLDPTGEGGKRDNHVTGCAEKGKKVSNKCQ
jgi:hypothetical protein